MQVWFDHKIKLKTKKLQLYDLKGQRVKQILTWMQQPDEVEQAGFRILIVEKSSDVDDALKWLNRLSSKQELSRGSYRKLATEASFAKTTSKTAVTGQKRGSSYRVLEKKDKRMLEYNNKSLANETPSFLVVGK